MTTLITGASDGLGLALARHYEARGETVIAIGRRPYTELLSVPYPSHQYLQIDLMRPDVENAVLRALGHLEIPSLDRVIHNAGIGYYGPPEQEDASDLEALVHLNFTVPIHLTLALMNRVEKASGKFVFIGSLAAALPCPQYATYAATKRGLEGFARNLRLEVGKRFQVQVIHPGAIRTRFHEKIGLSKQEMNWDRFPDVKRTATAVARVIDTRKAIATIGSGNRCLSAIARRMPSTFDRLMGSKFL